MIMFCSHFAEAIQATAIRSSNYFLIVTSLAAENLPLNRESPESFLRTSNEAGLLALKLNKLLGTESECVWGL